MNFKFIHKNTDCLCAKSSDMLQNDERIFARFIRKPNIRENDFKSYSDKGRTPTKNTCKAICSFLGVSVSLWNDESKDFIIELYAKLFKLNMKKKTDSILLFKLKNNIGVCKSTPSEPNPHHYDFYKSDEFDISKVEVIDIINIIDHI